jgi:two-component system response regulator VicR
MAKLIMVVDDEEDIRNTVRAILEREGYNVKIAVNGDDCLKKLEDNKPDLILMDIMMPGTPVRKVVSKMKDIKIIYLTVVQVSDAERLELLSRKNVVGFINKPFNVHDLVNAVRGVIG